MVGSNKGLVCLHSWSASSLLKACLGQVEDCESGGVPNYASNELNRVMPSLLLGDRNQWDETRFQSDRQPTACRIRIQVGRGCPRRGSSGCLGQVEWLESAFTLNQTPKRCLLRGEGTQLKQMHLNKHRLLCLSRRRRLQWSYTLCMMAVATASQYWTCVEVQPQHKSTSNTLT